ncbi:hypothetical protein BD413DRAFT_161041 [Trametes elegans]|nr:hypothetical protein BD413DRAFT_161041 [Trametes elegans]
MSSNLCQRHALSPANSLALSRVLSLPAAVPRCHLMSPCFLPRVVVLYDYHDKWWGIGNDVYP